MCHSILGITALLALGTRQVVAQTALATECYIKSDSSVHLYTNAVANPCGVVTPDTNFTSCCVVGDTCLADGICHYTHAEPSAPSVETGYYIGGCTDPSFSAAACPATCSDQTLPDVVYNETTDIWHCCGVDSNGDVRCDTPTAETFSAPAPSALSATFTVGASPSTASASLSSTSSTSSSPTSSTSSPTQSPKLSAGGLSGGAKAGIGIGCAIVGLAILGLLAWFFAHRRNKHSIEQGPLMSYKADTPVELMSYKKDKPAELPSRSVRAELG